MRRERADALFLFADAFTINYQKPIFDLATKRRRPTICAALESTDCLLTYGTSRLEMFRLAATLGLTIPRSILGRADRIIQLPADQAPSSRRTIRVPSTSAASLPRAAARVRGTRPQSVQGKRRAGST